MKTVLKVFAMLAVLVSCQKEEAFEVVEDASTEKNKTDLKFDVGIKRKTPIAKEWTHRANLKPRYGHTSLVYDNKMWIIGGMVDGMPQNDVLYSEDGINWHTATANAPFSGRTGHASTVFQGKMWVAGGKEYDPTDHDEDIDPGNQIHVEGDDHSNFDVYSELGDLWSSTDGQTWNEVDHIGGPYGNDLTLTAFNGSLWTTGGWSRDHTASEYTGFEDMWKSDDGSDWERLFPFSDDLFDRYPHAAMTVGKYFIIIGGKEVLYDGNVQFSDDGENWSFAVADPIIDQRHYHSLVHDGEFLWLMAGRAKNLKNDLLYSKNGLQWFEAGVTKQYPARKEHTSVFFKNKIWVINGLGESSSGKDDYKPLSDIWSFEEPGCCDIDDVTLEIQ